MTLNFTQVLHYFRDITTFTVYVNCLWPQVLQFWTRSWNYNWRKVSMLSSSCVNN